MKYLKGLINDESFQITKDKKYPIFIYKGEEYIKCDKGCSHLVTEYNIRNLTILVTNRKNTKPDWL